VKKPFVLIESTYEGEHNSTPLQIRRQAYWAILCGATGQSMGNRPIWLFDPGWQAAMDAAGSVSMKHLKSLFDSRAWFDLLPGKSHKRVTTGLGEFNGLDYLAAAITSDGSTLVAYMPSKRSITVDLSRISGAQAQAWWFDPRTGKVSAAGRHSTHGTQEFTPPGSGDWVLVLDDASKGRQPPGSN
jgi:hypothetical protein